MHRSVRKSSGCIRGLIGILRVVSLIYQVLSARLRRYLVGHQVQMNLQSRKDMRRSSGAVVLADVVQGEPWSGKHVGNSLTRV